MAVIDENGYGWFHGRKDDLISDAVVGGESDPDRETRITAYVHLLWYPRQ